MGSKLLCVMVKSMNDSHGTVINSFGPFFKDLLLKISEIYKNTLTRPIFELEEYS